MSIDWKKEKKQKPVFNNTSRIQHSTSPSAFVIMDKYATWTVKIKN